MVFCSSPLGLGLLTACLVMAPWLWWALRMCARRATELQGQTGQFRLLRRAANLAAADLRRAALRLHGHAGSTGDAADAPLRAMVHACRLAAEDLVTAAASPDAPRLDEDLVDLSDLIAEAVAGVTAAIAPGRRRFGARLDRSGPALWADRRALREALARVLTEAALNTDEGDSIAVSVERQPDGGLAIMVADEGSGFGPQDAGARVAGDSRGLPGRLALSRALVEAHGGALEVVAALGTGTRTSLMFPRQRVRAGVPAPLHAAG